MNVTKMVRFGESASTGSWAGVGINGGVEVALFDSSCPMEPRYHWERFSPIFAGLHLVLGQQAYEGDSLAWAGRGGAFGARLAANQPVGVAWKGTFAAGLAAGYPFLGAGCAVTIACVHENFPLGRLGRLRVQSERWPNTTLAPNTTSPNQCTYVETCNFPVIDPRTI